MEFFEDMPNELIIHILSFLPTKYAVLTSVLSKRWKFLWCYATKSIHLDDHDTFREHSSVNKDLDRITSFYNFVDRVVTLSKVPHIDKFYLVINGCLSGPDRLLAWITEVVKHRKAKQVEVYLSVNAYAKNVLPPLQIFNSTTLRVLKLTLHEYYALDESHISNSTALFLPNLKVLQFWTHFMSEKWMLLVYLFRASPRLEEANIGGSLCGHKKNFYNIYAPSLKTLRMKFESLNTSQDKFFIMAPILEDLVVQDNFFHRHVIKSNCLVNAKLDLGPTFLSKIQAPSPLYVNRVCNLLHRISVVKFLTLKAHTMDALSVSCNRNLTNLPQFQYLHCLQLYFVNYTSWDVLPKLLECTPNLEVLHLRKDFKGKDSFFRMDSTWVQPKNVPICLLSSLHQVEVYDCESHQVEFNLISYLLMHGEVLSSFIVELLPANSREDLKFKTKLMMIPRVSRTCEVKISSYSYSSQHSCLAPVLEENKCSLAEPQQHMPPQKLCYEDLRLYTNYFSVENLIIRTEDFKVYRGRFYQSNSLVKDVVVKKWVIPACDPFKKYKDEAMCSFHEELKLLQHPNFISHPYFMSVLGYCVEDNNERLGVVYDFKVLDRLESLIPKDSFKWLERIKVALVLACMVDQMHNRYDDLPSLTPILDPASVILDEDHMPTLFDFKTRSHLFCDEDDTEKFLWQRDGMTLKDNGVNQYGVTLLSLISKRVRQCEQCRPSWRHTSKCVALDEWSWMQYRERLVASPFCKSQVPLVHKDLMNDSTYNLVDGLKITRLAMRCVGEHCYKTNMHAIVSYLCKLRVVRENWDAIDVNKVISKYLNL